MIMFHELEIAEGIGGKRVVIPFNAEIWERATELWRNLEDGEKTVADFKNLVRQENASKEVVLEKIETPEEKKARLKKNRLARERRAAKKAASNNGKKAALKKRKK